MKKCELCAEEVPKEESICPRCGFEFPPEVRSDKRDGQILKKHRGKEAGQIKRDLAEKFSKYVSYFENLNPESGRPEEFASFVEEAVAHLHIPAVIGMGDELKLSEKEKTVVEAICNRLLDSGSQNLIHYVQTVTFMRLSNALFCMCDPKGAMRMIDAAIQRNPKDADALFNKSKLLFNAKDYEGSKRYLAKVIEKDPKREDARYLADLMEQL